MARSKRRLRNEQFDRLIRVWGLIVPILVALVASVTTLVVSLRSGTQYVEVRYTIAADDQRRLDRIRQDFNEAFVEWESTTDDQARNNHSETLRRLAEDEAAIMRLYYPEFLPRWPPGAAASGGPASRRIEVSWFTAVTTFLLVWLLVRIVGLFVLRSRFERQSPAE